MPSKRRDDEIIAKVLTVQNLLNINGAAFMNGAPLSGTPGNTFWLDPTHGDDDYDGKTPATAKATLPAVEDLTVDGHNDVVKYIAGTSWLDLAAAFEWDKSYTHFVGVCSPTKVAQRARIEQLSTLTAASPLFKVSGTGCVFKDLYFFQGVNDNTSLIDVQVTGRCNVFENVHFAGGGHAAQAIDGGASLHIFGGEENLFHNCVIGVDTIPAATGMAGLVYAATGGAPRNRFIDCDFTMYAGDVAAIFVELLGNSGIDRYQIFEDCWFINLGPSTMTQVFAIAAGFDPSNKRFLLKNCRYIGAGKWDDADRGAVYGDMNAVTGADASGKLVQMIT